MNTIRELFESSRSLDRRIEKVISFDSTENDQLKREVSEYVVTDSIARNFDRLLNRLDEGMGGGAHEIGVWVSGFYGSGKSSFTKYLGFALDPARQVDGSPFLEWLQAQVKSATLKAQLGALARRYPATVIMVDLASAQIAGATMVEISTVLYWTVMQWAGYAKDKKVAYLQFMLEKDGRMEAFENRISELSRGRTWRQIQNQPLVVNQFASRIAHEFYPEIFPDAGAFQKLRIDEAERENERVADMLELVRRRSGKSNIIFILDEVGQYIAARDNLILNLDGLAKNTKQLGAGKVWLIATAQQTLTEDDPNARFNSAKLFKLADRFPIRVDLEASDIREICYTRLLTKSEAADTELNRLFDAHGPALKHHTQLTGSRYYKASLEKEDFRKLYPFLPQHFDILLELLGRLAKTSGGIGLRSAIKVIQDVLVDQSGIRSDEPLLADAPVGTLATAITFYDTLRQDIQRSFKHVVEGVFRVEKAFGPDSPEVKVAKTIAVLQVLEDFPISRENIAALLHPRIDAPSQLEEVKGAVTKLLEEQAVHLSEIDGRLRFMSEAVAEMEAAKGKINIFDRDLRKALNAKLTEMFTHQPEVRLEGTRSVTAGVKTMVGSQAIPLVGEREPIHYLIEFVDTLGYEKRRDERLADSAQPANRTSAFWLARQEPGLERLLTEIVQCREIFNQNRNKSVEKEVGDYLNGQLQRAESLTGELEQRLRNMLASGSFIFRSTPTPVSSLDANINEAVKKHLDEVARKVFNKYGLAPVQAEGALAERFLKTPNLQQVASQNDPLVLVITSAGQKKINADHHALTAIRDYLAKHGQVEGGKLLDDFFAPEFGWSKDTTRYLLAALLVAGVIKLRVGGADVTVRGDSAIEALRNNNSFKKAGVALRDSMVSPETKMRAADRLLQLTGEQVMPLEQDISEGVLKHFPDLQRAYAPLEARLQGCGLPGSQRAADLQDSLTETLKGDASDATPRLGADDCPLFDHLLWAGEVHKSFANGIETTVVNLRRHLDELEHLPNAGATGDLLTATAAARAEAAELLRREDFFHQMPAIQTALKNLQISVSAGCKALASAQSAALDREIKTIESMPEWMKIGEEEQALLSARFDQLRITVPEDLEGIRKLLNHQYAITTELDRIREEIRELAKRREPSPEPPQPGGRRKPCVNVEITLPKEITSTEEIEALIAQVEKLRGQLAEFERVIVKWQ
jgi:hypothetical protein